MIQFTSNTCACPVKNVTRHKIRSRRRLKHLHAEASHWSQLPAKFSGRKSCENRDIHFSNCCVASRWSHDQSAMYLWVWEPLTLSYHHTKFGIDRHCISGDIIGLVCHVISEDHVIKGLYIMGLFVTWSCMITLPKDQVTLWIRTLQGK